MKISFHGGMCCGIKTISSLGQSPTFTVESLHEGNSIVAGRDRQGDMVDSKMNFYWESRPMEKAGDRFDVYLEHLKKHRPYGIVEVAIVTRAGGSPKLNGAAMGMVERGETDFLTAYTENGDEEGYGYDFHLQERWVPFLEERGFKLVTEAPNINSGNTVAVYHLVMKGGK